MLIDFEIFESKQVGLLYHWTYIEVLWKILSNDTMWSGMNFISFSRNKNLNFNNRPVRIIFDGTKMSNKFKFKPHLYMKDLNFKEEAEERIECTDFSEPETEYNKQSRGWEDIIKGVKKYIVDIYIDCEEYMYDKSDWCEKTLRKLQKLSPVKINTNIPELKKAGLWGMVKPKYQFLKDAEKLFVEKMINESKQVGILYHWTDMKSFKNILKDDKMCSWRGYISFSRNKNLNFGNLGCKIIFDGNKMSNHFKFEPHLYDKSVHFKSEAEERIKCNLKEENVRTNPFVPPDARPKFNCIKGIKNYIIGLEVSDKPWNCYFSKDSFVNFEDDVEECQNLTDIEIKRRKI